MSQPEGRDTPNPTCVAGLLYDALSAEHKPTGSGPVDQFEMVLAGVNTVGLG